MYNVLPQIIEDSEDFLKKVCSVYSDHFFKTVVSLKNGVSLSSVVYLKRPHTLQYSVPTAKLNLPKACTYSINENI